ncbi:MAG TPA: energy transducer TonB [Pyrinomonadaceae bacterium]|jgi:TonB family protein
MTDRTGKPRPTHGAREGSASGDPPRVAATRGGSGFAPGGDADDALKSLLESWRAPEGGGAAARSRLIVSYRQQFADRKETGMEGYRLGGDGFGARYALAGGARGEFRPTILEHAGLLHRLTAEVAAVAKDSRLTRAELRRDPLGFAWRLVTTYALAARLVLAQENVSYGALASLSIAITLACAVVAFDRRGARPLFAARVRDDLTIVSWLTETPKEQTKPDATGAGMADGGHGGGQKQKYEKPGGGGGGGRSEDKPAVGGKLPQASMLPQVLAPDPHPPAIKQPSLPTAATIRADPVLFPPDTRAINYGDPKSKATELSSGQGTGGGIGEGTGGGVGPGDGAGYGPGNRNNTGGGDPHLGGGGPSGGGGTATDLNRIFNAKDVTRRAVIVSRPEPLYTEEARKNQTTGTVVLRLVLNANGTVSNVVALSHLPDGLTERAIEAARRIQFTPAERDGRKVSQYATINYNFNIY